MLAWLGSRNLTDIFLRYAIYADISKQIFFVLASKKFFRLCISRVGTSKKAIAANGLLELQAKGKHKLCTNCMNYSPCLLFGCLVPCFKPAGDYQPFFFLFCMFFFKNTIKITSVLVYSYGPVELMEECFWRNSFGDHVVASEQWKVDFEIWKRDLL